MINEIPRNPPGATLLRTAGESQGISGRDSPDKPLTGPPGAGGDPQKTASPDEKGRDDRPLDAIVQELNGYVQDVQRELQFSIDQDNGEVVVKVVDARTQEVVREIPAEEVREMRKRLSEVSEKLFGDGEKTAVLFHAKA